MKTKGSSLIELLVIILILGIIISIFVPTYAENALRAKYKLCICARQKIVGDYLLLVTSGDLDYNKEALESFLEDKASRLEKVLPSCPFGGNYQVKLNPQGIIFLTCTHCGDTKNHSTNQTKE